MHTTKPAGASSSFPSSSAELMNIKSQNDELRATVSAQQSTISTLNQLLEQQKSSAEKSTVAHASEHAEEVRIVKEHLAKVTQEKEMCKMIMTNAINELNNLTEEKKKLEQALAEARAGIAPSSASSSSSSTSSPAELELRKNEQVSLLFSCFFLI